ncbi:CoA-binding protein [soil metagenome]
MSRELIADTLKLKKWAVVGANDDPAKFGYRIFRVLKDFGYETFPVNPKGGEIDGEKVYASIKDLPEKPEVVDMVVNPRTGLKVMADIRDAGIKYVWMQPGTRSDEIRDFAAASGIALIEDCILVRIGG